MPEPGLWTIQTSNVASSDPRASINVHQVGVTAQHFNFESAPRERRNLTH